MSTYTLSRYDRIDTEAREQRPLSLAAHASIVHQWIDVNDDVDSIVDGWIERAAAIGDETTDY